METQPNLFGIRPAAGSLEGIGDKTSFGISSAKTLTAFQDITDMAGKDLNAMKNIVHHSEATLAFCTPVITLAQALRDSVIHPLLPGNLARQEANPLIVFSTARNNVRPISAQMLQYLEDFPSSHL